MKKSIRISVFLSATCFLGNTTVMAQPPLEVPAQFVTIQDAIAAALPGQSVRVSVQPNGRGGQIEYSGNIVMRKGVSVIGVRDARLGLPAFMCTNQAQPTVSFLDAEMGRETRLEGLRIRNGTADRGAGIFITGEASPTIANNEILYQRSIHGAGIFADRGSSPRIYNNLFHECRAQRYGGAVFLNRPARSTSVSNNKFIGNVAELYGAGVCCLYGSMSLWGNKFYTNTAGARGGGIFVYRSSLVASRNIFQGNAANPLLTVGYGGGAFLAYLTRPYFSRNEFRSNVADHGGGLCIYSCELTARNLTLHGNRADIGGGGVEIMGFGGGAVTIEASDFRTNRAGTSLHTGVGGGLLINNRQPVTIMNCLFIANIAGYGDASGCGSRIESNPKAIVVNNTLVGNHHTNGMQGSGLSTNSNGPCAVVNNWFADHMVHVSRDQRALPVILRNNRYTSNSLGQLVMHPTDAVGIPLFVRPGVDFHCLPGDPGENQGMVGPAWIPTWDMDGQRRSWVAVDIGAYEIAAK